MADEKKCPHCGKPVPPTALGDICPECMLKAGLATQTEGPGGTGPHGTKIVHPPPTPEEIATLFPQLEILECLGRGGMGVVYKARQPRLNRLVALKILAREKEQDAQFAERFTREAQALARLNHPNIVTVHDFGYVSSRRGNEADVPQSVTAPPPHVGGYENTPQGHCYLLMEFVDGLNLRQLLQTRKMPSEQALAIVPKICEALQYAHEQGIVHRDIKPENILLNKHGQVKIADFGIAKMMGDEAGQQALTGAKDAVGTPHYMAPEQIEKPLSVDHRADIYSLGVVFYEMLTGELPLGKFQPPSQKVQIDVRLDEVVLHALEKEPERRYQQASQVKTAVETIAATSEFGRSRREEAQTEKAGSQSRLTPAATAFHRGERVALWVFILTVLAASVITFLLPTTYVASARVKLTGLSPQSYNPYYVQNEFEVIKSDSVLGKVAASLNLSQRWGKRFNGGAPLSDGEVMALIRHEIDLRPVRNTSIIDIRFFSQSPEEAAEIANQFAETYCALPPGHRGDIIDHAVAPFHPIRPNTLLNIFIGVVAGGIIGILAGLVAGLLSFWRLRATQSKAASPAQKPDRFWRRFAVTVLALVILVPVAFYILIIVISIVAGRLTERHEQPATETIRSDYIGQAWFPQGDSIEITSVERNKNQMTVQGHYQLVSHDQASLVLYITSTNRSGFLEGAKQTMTISKGSGDFELIHPHLVPGLPHVSMYADGKPFAALYFGTKVEALEESKASRITNTSSASALQFRLVLSKDSTAPADWLPWATGHDRLQVSRQVLLDDNAIARAGVDFTQGRRMIAVRFTDAGAKKFEAITATNIGHQLAIVFHSQVLSAPVIQSVIPGGECRVDGSMNASEVNEIVDYLNRTTTASDQTWKFAAPCERILPFRPRPEFLVGWLDLDSGTVMTNSRISWETRAGHEWIQNNSLDVVATESDRPFPVLLGIDMIIAPAPTNGWNNVTAADVINNWTLLQEEPRQMQMFGAMPGQTDTFFFQTREGGKGVLQILGFADNPPGVKVRYKLVENAGATTEATQTFAGQPPVVVETQPVSGARNNEPDDLRAAQAKLAELRVNYGEQNPTVQKALARVKELEWMTKEEPNAPADLREAKARLAELAVDYSPQNPAYLEQQARVLALEQDEKGHPDEPADLREAKAHLAELRVSYSEQNPEVQKALARIQELERMSKEEPDASVELREAKAHLAELRLDYAEQNPRIQEALARVKVLEQSNAATTNSTRP